MAAHRCRNVYEDNDEMNVFVDELHPMIHTILERYHEIEPREGLAFEKLVQFARDKRENFRTMQTPLHREKQPLSPIVILTVNFLEMDEEMNQYVFTSYDEEGMNALESEITSNLPSMEEESQVIAYANRRQAHAPALRLCIFL